MKPYYQDSAVTIYHGDCREVLPTVEACDVVLTDPPYGVGKDAWDAESCEWVMGFLSARTILVTPGIKNLFRWPAPQWVVSYCFPKGEKRAVGGGINCWEPVLVYGVVSFPLDCRIFRPVASVKIDGHSTPKPVSPWQWLIAESSCPGEVILDPFMGSGTTLRSAKDLGRRAIGIEIEERYCEIAAKRMSQEVLPL